MSSELLRNIISWFALRLSHHLLRAGCDRAKVRGLQCLMSETITSFTDLSLPLCFTFFSPALVFSNGHWKESVCTKLYFLWNAWQLCHNEKLGAAGDSLGKEMNSKNMCLHSDGKGPGEYSHLSNPGLFPPALSRFPSRTHPSLTVWSAKGGGNQDELLEKSLNSLDCFAISVVRMFHV